MSVRRSKRLSEKQFAKVEQSPQKKRAIAPVPSAQHADRRRAADFYRAEEDRDQWTRQLEALVIKSPYSSAGRFAAAAAAARLPTTVYCGNKVQHDYRGQPPVIACPEELGSLRAKKSLQTKTRYDPDSFRGRGREDRAA